MQYPDLHEVSMENTIDKSRKLTDDRKLDMGLYEQLRSEKISKDKVEKFFGMFSTPTFYLD